MLVYFGLRHLLDVLAHRRGYTMQSVAINCSRVIRAHVRNGGKILIDQLIAILNDRKRIDILAKRSCQATYTTGGLGLLDTRPSQEALEDRDTR
jgi:hypothetical protein